MADFTASYAFAVDILLFQTIVNQFSKIGFLYSCFNEGRWNISLYSHGSNPFRQYLLDLNNKVNRFLISIRPVFSILPKVVEFASFSNQTWIDLEHVRLEFFICKNGFKHFQIFLRALFADEVLPLKRE